MKHKRSGKNTVLRNVLIVIISIVLGVSVYLWNAGNLAGNRLPMPFGIGAAVVLSGSMEPAISVDDVVIVHEGGRYQVGDIVVYESSDGMMITHRICSRDNDIVITQGDANSVSDEPIHIDQIKGSVIMRIPQAGVIVRYLKKPSTVVLVVIAAFLLMELSYRKEKKQDDDALDDIKKEIQELKTELEQK